MSRRGGGRGGRGGGKPSLTKELLKRSAADAGLDDRHVKVLDDITKPLLFPDFLWRSTGRYWDEKEAVDDRNSSSSPTVSLQQQLPVPTKRPTTVVHTIEKQRELMQRFQQSAQCIAISSSSSSSTGGKFGIGAAASSVPLDVIRYRTRHKPRFAAPDAAYLATLGKTNTKLAGDERYFPAELIRPAHTATNTSSSSWTNNTKKPASSSAGGSTRKTMSSVVKLEDDEHDDNEEDDEVAIDVEGDPEPDLATSQGEGGGISNAKDMDSNNKIHSMHGGNNDELDVLDEAPAEDEEDDEDYTQNYYATDDDDSAGGGDDDNEATF
jgi:hypothetical protein